MTDDHDYQERAAIKEYLANLPRKEAERQAREELRKSNMKKRAEAELNGN